MEAHSDIGHLVNISYTHTEQPNLGRYRKHSIAQKTEWRALIGGSRSSHSPAMNSEGNRC